MSNNAVTTGKHQDFVGGLESKGRIPGADQATSGSMFVESFPREKRQEPEEHIPKGYGEPNQNQQRTADRSIPTSTTASSIGSQPGPQNPPGLNTHMPAQFTNEPLQPISRVVVDKDPYAAPPRASDTLTGATSADVHQGLGHPGAGMSSAEYHHDGQSHRKEHGPLDRHGLKDRDVEQ